MTQRTPRNLNHLREPCNHSRSAYLPEPHSITGRREWIEYAAARLPILIYVFLFIYQQAALFTYNSLEGMLRTSIIPPHPTHIQNRPHQLPYINSQLANLSLPPPRQKAALKDYLGDLIVPQQMVQA